MIRVHAWIDREPLKKLPVRLVIEMPFEEWKELQKLLDNVERYPASALATNIFETLNQLEKVHEEVTRTPGES